jgi:hypothetical protein
MNVWFARCNGTTAHNAPGTRLYVPGEPPRSPARDFNYKHECIMGGFARVGWPAAGDLRAVGWRQTARAAYPDISDEHLGYLEQFASIRVGDLMLIPAYRDKFDVRVGVVSPPPTERSTDFDGFHPYHYHYDVQSEAWYENAHRVPVQWSRKFATLSCLGRVWLKAFGQIVKGSAEVVEAARERGLLTGE